MSGTSPLGFSGRCSWLTALIVVLAWNRIRGADTDYERPSPAEDRSGSLHRPSRSGFCNRIDVAVFAVFRGVV